MGNNDQALVLDFGGVMTRTLFETHPQTEEALGLPAGSLTWRGPFAPESDPLWVAMQNNELTEREYWMRRTKEVGEMVGENWTEMAQFVRSARGADPQLVLRPEAVRTIADAKDRGYRLAVLSNELDLFYGADFRQKLPVLEHFDLISDATYTGILKPDAKAYLDCADALGLAPDRCVFVDDQPRNIRGAQAVGMRTVLFDVQHPGESFVNAMALLENEELTNA